LLFIYYYYYYYYYYVNFSTTCLFGLVEILFCFFTHSWPFLSSPSLYTMTKKFFLTWPLTPTAAELNTALNTREDVGEVRISEGPGGSIFESYHTTVWNVKRRESDLDGTVMLPPHYKGYWHHLIYSKVISSEIYKWLINYQDQHSVNNSFLTSAIDTYAKLVVYLTTVQKVIKSQAFSNSNNIEASTRIAAFDEYLVKDRWELHDASIPQLRSKENQNRFKIDIAKDAKTLREQFIYLLLLLFYYLFLY
jgi:hypothetical protein